MNTTIGNKKVHQGRNAKRLREAQGMIQEAIADKLHMTQQNVSLYESQKVLDEDILKRFAVALGVPANLIRDMEEDPATIIIEHNTFQEGSANNVGEGIGIQNNNPIDKIIELSKEKEALLERLLKSEQEHNQKLCQEILNYRSLQHEVAELKKKLEGK